MNLLSVSRPLVAFVVLLAASAAAVLGAAATARAEAPVFDCAPGARVLFGMTRLASVASALESGRALAVLAVGSSSTEGVGASGRDLSYPAQLQGILARRWIRSPVSVENAGIGGETAEQTLQRLAVLVTARRYDLVVWQVGTNDALRGEDEGVFRKRIETGVQLVKDSGADLVLMDQQDFPTIRDRSTYERYVAAIAEVASQMNVPVFSRYRLMKTWASRGDDQLLATLASDRFHMNDTGYACVARVLAADLAAMARMGAAVAVGR